MNKYIKTMALVLGLSSILNANTFFQNKNIEDDFTNIQRIMNNMMNQSFFHDEFGKFENINYPKVNMEELKDKYILKFELAGIDKKEIKLALKDNILVIEGEKKSTKEDKSKDYLKQEMFYGQFKRVIELPDDVIIDKLTTKYNNGILTITIPRNKTKESSYKILKIN